MAQRIGRSLSLAAVLVVGVAALLLFSPGLTGLLAPPGASSSRSSVSAAPGGLSRSAVNDAAGPGANVSLLASFSELYFGYGFGVSLNFTVPHGGAQVIYAWSIGGNFTGYSFPTLPAGMTIGASTGPQGIADGNLTAGQYTTELSYGGWTNTVAIAVYGVSESATLQFGSISQMNPTKLATQNVSVTLPADGSTYVGVEGTGGTWPVQNSSISHVDVNVSALRGGDAAVIGEQSGNVLSFTTVALSTGIVGVAIDATPALVGGFRVSLLAGETATTGGWNLSFPLSFFVPPSVTEVLYVWSIGGNFTPFSPPELPAGLSVAASIGFEGVAVGNLSSGTYATNLSYAGWTNTAGIAVYGVSGGTNVSFRFGSLNVTNPVWHGNESLNLSLPAGAADYLGVESTGGTWPVLNDSFSPLDEYAWALRGGLTNEIGRQSSNQLSFQTIALTAGIVGVGIFANPSGAAHAVTFHESGLPAGKSWSVVLGGHLLVGASGALNAFAASGELSYVIRGPAGYRVLGVPPSGTMHVAGAVSETVAFVPAKTVNLSFKETGLPPGNVWCVQVAGWQQCGSGRTLTYADLTPGTYSYAIAPPASFGTAAHIGAVALAGAGTLDVMKRTTVSLRFTEQLPVLFTESGLAPGTSWSVTIGGRTWSSTNATLLVTLSSGSSYAYRLGSVVGYAAAHGVHHLRVGYAPATVAVHYSASS
ncbi:MAG TPA: hypothetical protein VMH49_01330 [Thermoplasmata archaeon]|nr:hypothetical protein [Thermoplasmata archaeon]